MPNKEEGADFSNRSQQSNGGGAQEWVGGPRHRPHAWSHGGDPPPNADDGRCLIGTRSGRKRSSRFPSWLHIEVAATASSTGARSCAHCRVRTRSPDRRDRDRRFRDGRSIALPCRQARARVPGLKTIVFSRSDDREHILAALLCGRPGLRPQEDAPRRPRHGDSAASSSTHPLADDRISTHRGRRRSPVARPRSSSSSLKDCQPPRWRGRCGSPNRRSSSTLETSTGSSACRTEPRQRAGPTTKDCSSRKAQARTIKLSLSVSQVKSQSAETGGSALPRAKALGSNANTTERARGSPLLSLPKTNSAV